MDRQVWFQAVYSAFGIRWHRKDTTTLVGYFPGYKPEEGTIAEEILMKCGGRVMDVQFDSISGNTFYTVREPKNLQRPE